MNDELTKLGDTLEEAFARDLAVSPVADLTAHRRGQLSRKAVVGTVIGGLGVASFGVAAALMALDEDEVAAGLPGGSVIFIGTDPTCTAADDPVVFDCVLARAPLYDAIGRPLDPSTPTLPRETLPADWTAPEASLVLDPDPAQYENDTLPDGSVYEEVADTGPEPTDAPPDPNFDWTGSIMTFVDSESNVAGSCVGGDPEGVTWTCYAGQAAVDRGHISAESLGAPQAGPGIG